MSLLKLWNPKFVRDSCNHFPVRIHWQSLQCSVAVLVVRFVSHRTVSVLKVTFWSFLSIKDIIKIIILRQKIYCIEQNCALLGYNAASSVNLIPTFRNNLLFPT